jgi:hypothetical protein
VDFQGSEMYENVGGIQVISKISGMKIYDVPLHDLLTDETRNNRSIGIALNPLVGQATPAN